eukprot:3244421-Pyramimonas_sp.AAC.1
MKLRCSTAHVVLGGWPVRCQTGQIVRTLTRGARLELLQVRRVEPAPDAHASKGPAWLDGPGDEEDE